MDKSEIMRERLRKVSKERESTSAERKKRMSKDRLKQNVKKKLQTTFIGAISKVEAFLGDVWGHGLEEKECTDAQLDFYDIWQQCRDEILNLGNAQIRAIDKEFEFYDMEYKGTEVKFFNNSSNGDRNGKE